MDGLRIPNEEYKKDKKYYEKDFKRWKMHVRKRRLRIPDEGKIKFFFCVCFKFLYKRCRFVNFVLDSKFNFFFFLSLSKKVMKAYKNQRNLRVNGTLPPPRMTFVVKNLPCRRWDKNVSSSNVPGIVPRKYPDTSESVSVYPPRVFG